VFDVKIFFSSFNFCVTFIISGSFENIWNYNSQFYFRFFWMNFWTWTIFVLNLILFICFSKVYCLRRMSVWFLFYPLRSFRKKQFFFHFHESFYKLQFKMKNLIRRTSHLRFIKHKKNCFKNKRNN
jgi:hypothetical protein